MNAECGMRNAEFRIKQGRIGKAEAVRLFQHQDLIGLGMAADRVRKKIHGNRVHYTLNLNLNYSNICTNARCRFCAFGRKKGEPGAYTLRIGEAQRRVRAALKQGLNEVHIVGGLHPDLPFHYYTDLLKAVRDVRKTLRIKAFSAVEIDFFSGKFGITLTETLTRLRNAGLTTLRGGGAEVFSPRVRRLLCPRKISGERWLDVHETAHRMGIPTSATMLYGHLETDAERVDHLLALRKLQDRTHGFLSFAPLAFHPSGTALAHLSGPDGFTHLKVMAVSRLVLDNIPHLRALWTYLGPKMAQTALCFGADDLGGTLAGERIARAAGSGQPDALTQGELEGLIREAGRDPVQ